MALSRIQQCFKKLSESSRKALIPYIVGGDPQPDVTVPMMHALVEAGADILEIGVPFSDPMAEGPTIQLAHERALEYNTSIHDVFAAVSEFRQTDNDTPIVLMGYANPVVVTGYERFAQLASDAGVDGLLTVDMPPEEAGDLSAALTAKSIDIIYLIAPTTTPDRMKNICANATGYVYYVSLKGVTGASNIDIDSVSTKVGEIRQYTDLPVAVGFGIKDSESAKAVSQVADGVVVGSALVNNMAELGNGGINDTAQYAKQAVQLIAEMRTAID
jgi:tryptophan synthase alpha chain